MSWKHSDGCHTVHHNVDSEAHLQTQKHPLGSYLLFSVRWDPSAYLKQSCNSIPRLRRSASGGLLVSYAKVCLQQPVPYEGITAEGLWHQNLAKFLCMEPNLPDALIFFRGTKGPRKARRSAALRAQPGRPWQ